MQRFGIPLVISVMSVATPALAETELAHPVPTLQSFKLDPETGCYHYTGRAGQFIAKFKRGAYVSVVMDDSERIPIMDAPEFKTNGPGVWFGPLPESRNYIIEFMPAMLIGSPGMVDICGRTSSPGQNPLGLTLQEKDRLNKMADEMMATDPYSNALLEEPKVLLDKALDDDSEPADVCGLPVRDVAIQTGEGADASPLQPRVAGSVKHYANLYESPFEVFAVCTPADTGQPVKTVELPSNTKDCYFAGGRLECSYLASDEVVPVE